MIYSHMPYVWPLNWQIHSAYTDGPLVKDRVSTCAEHDLMYQQGVYKIESRCCLMVSLTVIAVKLNSTASIILFRKDYLSQQWSFSSQGNPSSSISLFYKVWQKFYWNFWEGWPHLAKGCMERWNGGISETQNGGKRLHREVSIVAVKVDNTGKKTLWLSIMFYDTSHILSLMLVISRFRIFGRSKSDFKIHCHSVIPPNRVTHQETLATRKKIYQIIF